MLFDLPKDKLSGMKGDGKRMAEKTPEDESMAMSEHVVRLLLFSLAIAYSWLLLT